MNSRSAGRLLVTLLGLLVLFHGISATAQTPTASAPDRYFGLHIHRLVKLQTWVPEGNRRTAWPAVRFGSWRLWDAYVSWPFLEPKPDQWAFDVLDQYVDQAEKAGVEVLLPLGLSPTWASARPEERSGYGPGNAAEPKDMELWRRYVRKVATRYKGRIQAYEIWNEVNAKEFFTGTQDTMLELARIAYATIKEVDPNAIVVSPSVTGGGIHLKWFESYLQKGGGAFADVISYHFYVPWGKPEEMLPLIQEAKAAMVRTGNGDKPLWNTETGWWMANGDGTPDHESMAKRPWKRLSVQSESGAYLVRAMLVGKTAGLGRFYWYAWDNLYGYGLLEPRSGRMKPAATAYDRVAHWHDDALATTCTRQDSIWTCVIDQRQGDPIYVVWSQSDQSRTFVVPGTWRVSRRVLVIGGEEAVTPGDRIVVDGVPTGFSK